MHYLILVVSLPVFNDDVHHLLGHACFLDKDINFALPSFPVCIEKRVLAKKIFEPYIFPKDVDFVAIHYLLVNLSCWLSDEQALRPRHLLFFFFSISNDTL